MENKIIEQIWNKAHLSCRSMLSYSNFVSSIEYLAEENRDIFNNQVLLETYHNKWMRLEIINACALSEWEDSGKATNFSASWECKFKKDAEDAVDQLLQFIILCATS